jgi:hypothetical protein
MKVFPALVSRAWLPIRLSKNSAAARSQEHFP